MRLVAICAAGGMLANLEFRLVTNQMKVEAAMWREHRAGSLFVCTYSTTAYNGMAIPDLMLAAFCATGRMLANLVGNSLV